MKTCNKCGEEKPWTFEHYRGSGFKDGKQRFKGICKVCDAGGPEKYAKRLERAAAKAARDEQAARRAKAQALRAEEDAVRNANAASRKMRSDNEETLERIRTEYFKQQERELKARYAIKTDNPIVEQIWASLYNKSKERIAHTKD